ncbi:RsmB/NOP family class I SAM-dependent RNA methyltransferase [Arabiibacter massiliensis]|uniref:RsmB/NOP family class I SAM-dependent RNA methyltransferase n=1 Tax=Arabiibacter massiliensis TaxID=1870985 RepID=UPI0009BB59D4|nr:transcription antitermination factor NusB [Arabiibacter massiliensis]
MPEKRPERREPKGYAGPKNPPKKKPRSKASPARLAALDVVRAVRERDAFAQEVIGTRIDRSDLTSEDRAFATKLALGVVSACGTLDEIIDRALDKPSDVQPDVRDALRVSTYEIIFLGKTPYAAVDQGVELVRSFAMSAAGLANAVLRKIVLLRGAFPFGDPMRDLEALARLHAFPVWLARKLIADLGPEAAIDFMRASNEQAPLFIAVNAIKVKDEALVAAFEKIDEGLDPISIDGAPIPGCYRVLDTRALLLPEVKRMFAQGRILVSDAASQLVAASVLPEAKPASLLEIGAGRATKTILLQSCAQRAWGSQIEEHVALDNHAFKMKVLRERVDRYGAQVSEALTGDALKLGDAVGERAFDLVFVDAPCSGLGTLRRHPEIRWRLEPAGIASFARVQLGMLNEAASHVAPGGTLAYATCTVTREENNGVVKAFLESEAGADFKLAPVNGRSCVATRLTDNAPDAHFAVRFVRKG